MRATGFARMAREVLEGATASACDMRKSEVRRGNVSVSACARNIFCGLYVEYRRARQAATRGHVGTVRGCARVRGANKKNIKNESLQNKGA